MWLMLCVWLLGMLPTALQAQTDDTTVYLYYFESDDAQLQTETTQPYAFVPLRGEKVTIVSYGLDANVYPTISVRNDEGTPVASAPNPENSTVAVTQFIATQTGIFRFDVGRNSTAGGVVRVMLFVGDPLNQDVTYVDKLNPLLPSRAFMVAGRNTAEGLRMLVDVLPVDRFGRTPFVFASRGTFKLSAPTVERFDAVDYIQWFNTDGQEIYTVNIRPTPERGTKGSENVDIEYYNNANFFYFDYYFTIGAGGQPVQLLRGNECEAAVNRAACIQNSPTLGRDTTVSEPPVNPADLVGFTPTIDTTSLPECVLYNSGFTVICIPRGYYETANQILGSSLIIDGTPIGDIIQGTNGNNTINGNDTTDYIFGGLGDDTIIGGDGDDFIFGEPGNDCDLRGGNGNDLIDGGAGNDCIYGEAGDDTLISGSGNNILEGGTGNDTLIFDAPQTGISIADPGNTGDSDIIQINAGVTGGIETTGGDTSDILDFSNFNVGINLDINNGALTAIGGGLSMQTDGTIVNVIGTNQNDTIVGDASNDSFTGGQGDDILIGGAGVDNLNGGLGNDTLDGGDGNDNLLGGSGNDTINGGSGDDTVFGGDSSDIINGGDGNDTLYAGNGASDFNFFGNDEIYGGTGNDNLYGAGGDDILFGEAGDDRIFGSAGQDVINGGDGTDEIILVGGILYGLGIFNPTTIVTNGETVVAADVIDVQGGTGNISIQVDTTDTLSFENYNQSVCFDMSLSTDSNINCAFGSSFGITQVGGDLQIVEGSNFSDTIFGSFDGDTISGNGGSDFISGGFGNDIINGGSGNDTLIGGSGNDTINGGADNDFISGGDNNDILNGGQGQNQVFGDAGTDTLIVDQNQQNSFCFLGGCFLLGSATSLDGGADGQSDAYQFSGAAAGWVDISNETNDTIVFAFSLPNFDLNLVSVWQEVIPNVLWVRITNPILSGLQPPTLECMTAGNDTTLSGPFSGLNSVNNHIICGLAGEDVIDAGGGTNLSLGGSGNDTLIVSAAQTGQSGLMGGSGNDTYSFATGASGTVVIIVTDANDVIDFSGFGTGVNFNLANGTNTTGGLTIITSNTSPLSATCNTEDDNLEAISATCISEFYGPTGPVAGWNTPTGGLINTLIGSNSADTLIGNANANIITANAGMDNVNGGAGDDTINGGNDNDILNGGGGLDLVFGGNDDDTLVVDSNQAVGTNLSGDAGADTYLINAGAAGDINIVSDGSDTLSFANFGSGVVFTLPTLTQNVGGVINITTNGSITNLIGSAFVDTLTGGTLGDTINGLDGDDTIDGAGGNDFLYGGAGDDTLIGNNGDDTLFGGIGNDTLNGGNNNDTLNGGDNDDTLNGDSGNDTLNGDDGNDILNGGDGTDILNGGDGNDILNGGAGNDILNGGAGDDVLDGGAGTDTLNGNDGDDRIIATSGGGSGNTIDGGNNTIVGDTYDASAIAGTYTIDISTGVGQNGDTFINIENVTGGSGANTLIGDGNNNTLNGNGGNDTLRGGDGNDILNGGDGNDILETDQGIDTIDGGAGIDTLQVGALAGAGAIIDLQAGTITHDGFSFVAGETITGIENLIGGAFGDQLTGDASINNIDGNGGDDIIDGAGGNDILNGGTGTNTYSGASGSVNMNVDLTLGFATDSFGDMDTISNFQNITGGSGDDTLSGTVGVNVINGGLGDDIINGRGGADTLDGGGGIDTYDTTGATQGVVIDLATGTVTNDGFGNAETATNFENVTGTNFNDTITGNALANDIDGNDNNDTINGLGGSDMLDGGAGIDTYDTTGATQGVVIDLATGIVTNDGFGNAETATNFEIVNGTGFNDTISGTTGVNTLNGNGGDDVLNGNAGADIINGGAGNDTFSAAGGGSNLVIDLSTSTVLNDGFGSVDTITSIENVIGTDQNDTITGSAGDNVLNGGGGIDTINGGAGNDVIDGGDDADIINAGSGQNDIIGGAGDDIITTDSAQGVDALNATTIDGGAGADTYIFTDGASGYVDITGDSSDTLNFSGVTSGVTIDLSNSGYQNVYGGLWLQITNIINVITGNGNDVVTGTSGADNIQTGGGMDTVYGGDGDDTINSGAGADTVFGGLGNDIINTEAGADTVYGGEQSCTGALVDGADTINSGADDDIVYGGNDNFGGGDCTDAGDTSIDGDTGNDTIYGGNNNAFGGTGDDGGDASIIGGAGNDTIYGGNNNAFGGTGNDGADTITDTTGGDTDTLVGGNNNTGGGSGGDVNDTISGNDGDAGADTLIGDNTGGAGGTGAADVINQDLPAPIDTVVADNQP
jgi:Ca2+-binding RTX toxin-like protein